MVDHESSVQTKIVGTIPHPRELRKYFRATSTARESVSVQGTIVSSCATPQQNIVFSYAA
jgi:hypothetical protein